MQSIAGGIALVGRQIRFVLDEETSRSSWRSFSQKRAA
jgi:hypothetical protein